MFKIKYSLGAVALLSLIVANVSVQAGEGAGVVRISDRPFQVNNVKAVKFNSPGIQRINCDSCNQSAPAACGVAQCGPSCAVAECAPSCAAECGVSECGVGECGIGCCDTCDDSSFINKGWCPCENQCGECCNGSQSSFGKCFHRSSHAFIARNQQNSRSMMCHWDRCLRRLLTGRRNDCDEPGHCYLCPEGCGGQGCPPYGCYDMIYSANPEYFDQRDAGVYAAQGYGAPVAVPLAPNVEQAYNYSWGMPASRMTRVSRVVP